MQIEEFEELIRRSNEITTEIKRIETDMVKPLKSELSEIDGKITAALDDMEVKTFKSKYGSVTKNVRYSYKVPKDLESKQKLFKWLHEKYGSTAYWEKINIPSQSLNAIAKEQIEIAKEEGDIDFSIPGLDEPSVNTYISRRK